MSAKGSSDRAAVEVVGVALLVGVVLLGGLIVVALGNDSIERTQDAVEVEQSAQSLSQFDSTASRVALGSTTSQTVDLGVGGSDAALTADSDRGRLTVTYVNSTSGTSTTVVNRSLGAVVVDHGRTEIAYQGGGVWRRDGERSIPLSRPEIHYDARTLTMPIIVVNGSSSIHSDVAISEDGPVVRHFPNGSTGLDNRLQNGKVVITVQSRYYDGWGQFFEAQTDALVFYDDGTQSVTVVFLSLPSAVQPEAGVIATSGPGQLRLAGTGAYIDSYNSSVGPYSTSASENGTVEAAGDVNITGDGEIAGDVRSGGAVGIESTSGTIDGDVYWTEGFDNDGTVTGENESITGITSLEPIDYYVSLRVSQIRQTNNNSETGLIDSDDEFAGSSGELGPGRYYFEQFDLSNSELVLNTTDGNITIAVRDWALIGEKNDVGNLTVKGDGRVRFIVAGQDEVSVSPTGLGSRNVNFHVGKGSTVHVAGDESQRFQLLAPKDFNATVAGDNSKSAAFTGVIYAPTGRFGSGYVYIKQGDVYGAVVTGNLTLGQYGAVHFDYVLRDARLPLSPTVSRLDYLHVSTTPIVVEDD